MRLTNVGIGKKPLRMRKKLIGIPSRRPGGSKYLLIARINSYTKRKDTNTSPFGLNDTSYIEQYPPMVWIYPLIVVRII